MQDHCYGDRMGIAARRETERVAASLGKLPEALPLFEPANNVCQAGVLWLLPALLAQGLLWISDRAGVVMFYGVKSHQDARTAQAR